jgi:hypothetical protein
MGLGRLQAARSVVVTCTRISDVERLPSVACVRMSHTANAINTFQQSRCAGWGRVGLSSVGSKPAQFPLTDRGPMMERRLPLRYVVVFAVKSHFD